MQLGDPLPDLTAEELASFERGRALFSKRFKPSEGLGPLYNSTSCVGCHSDPVVGGGADLYRNFYVSLLLLALSGAATSLLAHPAGRQEPTGESAARGLVVSLVAFAALATAQLSVGLALPSMVGMGGLLLVAALCFGSALFGQRGSVRVASRLLLALLFLLPWLLWSSLGALP